MNKDQLLEVLDPVVDLNVSTMPETSRVSLTGNGNLYISTDGNTFPLVEGGRRDLLKHIGVTEKLARRLSSNTASQVLTELYQDGGATSALMHSGNVVGFAPKGRYKAVPVSDVVDSIVDALGVDTEYNRAMVLPNHDVRIEVVGADKEEVFKGDVIRSGVCVQWSPVGLTNPLVQSFGLRLVCMNGMTSRTVLEEYELGLDAGPTNTQVYNWVKDSVTNAYGSMPMTVAQWRGLAEDQISPIDRPQLIGALAKDAGVKGHAANALWAQATEEPPETAYDVLNLLSWLTSHVLDNPERVVKAQNALATFTEEQTHKRFCPTCERVG